MPPERRIGRRQFLQGAVAAVGGAAVGEAFASPASARRVPAHARHHRKRPAEVTQTVLESGVIVPTARWLVEENAQPGTLNWVVTGIQKPVAIEGFASQVSAVPGDELVLFVNTNAPSFHVEVYRMGYYQGLGGRLIDESDSYPGTPQPPPTVTPGVNTASCPWNPSLTMKVSSAWLPGNYLLKLVGDGGQQQYIPLTVRNDSSSAA
ncbi:MAG: N,N-dimethylformamidase beta subunit family domain-containing protein, partial [Acidimicrobiales bacterium]